MTRGHGVGGTAAPARHHQRFQRSVRLFHAAILLSVALVVLAIGLAGEHLGLHVLLAAGHVVLAALVLLRGERPVQLLLALPLVLLAAMPAFGAPGDASGGVAVFAFSIGAVRSLGPRAYAVAVLGVVVAYAVVLRATGQDLDLDVLLSTYALALVHTFLAGAFIRSIERSTQEIDRAEADSAAERLRLLEQEELERAVDGVRHVLHDDILTALRAVADGTGGRADSVSLSAAAVAAVDRLGSQRDEDAGEDESALGTLASLLAEVRATAPVAVRLRADLDCLPEPLEPATRAAASRALLECARNAHRHAGVDQVFLTVHAAPGELSFTVRDHGPGFADGSAEGVGLRESVRGAVASVGGRASVDSDASGTTVRLSLPTVRTRRRPPLLSRTYALTISAGASRELVPIAVAPIALTWLVIGSVHLLAGRNPPVSALVLLGATVLCVIVAVRLATSAPGLRWLCAVTLAGLGLQVAGLALLPPGAMQDLRSWSIAAAAAPLLVLALVLPVRWGVGLLAAHVAAVVVAAALAPELTGGGFPVGSVNAVLSAPVITMLVGVVLRRNARQVEAERLRRQATAVERMRRGSAARLASLHLDHTRRVVVPWLREVASGRVDVTVPAVREQARLLALETRDDLYAPGFHDPHLRAEVSGYRSLGGVVDIRPGFEPGAYARRTGQVLHAVLSGLAGAGHHRVTLTPGARLVVLPPPSAPVPAYAGVRVERDEFALVLEFEDR